MTLRTVLAAWFLAGAALAAPRPYSPPAAAEAVFEASSPPRAAALANYLVSPELAAAVAGKPAPEAQAWLASRLKVEVVGGSAVRVTLEDGSEGAALSRLKALIRAVTVEPSKEETSRLLAQLELMRGYGGYDGIRGGKAVAWRVKRAALVLEDGRGFSPSPYDNGLSDIRLNRPTVKSPPRLVPAR